MVAAVFASILLVTCYPPSVLANGLNDLARLSAAFETARIALRATAGCACIVGSAPARQIMLHYALYPEHFGDDHAVAVVGGLFVAADSQSEVERFLRPLKFAAVSIFCSRIVEIEFGSPFGIGLGRPGPTWAAPRKMPGDARPKKVTLAATLDREGIASLSGVSISADGRWAALAGHTRAADESAPGETLAEGPRNELQLMEIDTGEIRWRLTESDHAIAGGRATFGIVQFAPSGDWLVVQRRVHVGESSERRESHDALLILAAADGTEAFSLPARLMRGASLAISSDSRWLAFCDAQAKELALWDLKDRRQVAKLPLPAEDREHRLHLTNLTWAELSFAPSGKHLLLVYKAHAQRSFSVNNTHCRLFALPDLAEEANMHGVNWPSGVQYLPSGPFCLYGRFGVTKGEFNGRLLALRETTSTRAQLPPLVTLPPTGEVVDLAVSSDGARLAIVQQNYEMLDSVGQGRRLAGRSLIVYDPTAGREIASASLGQSGALPAGKIAFADGGRAIIFAGTRVQKFALPESQEK